MIPIPEALKSKSSVHDLKRRLDWGEPALTIIDVRSRDSFNACRITGAVSIPTEGLVERALNNLDLTRDIYLYDSTDEGTTFAAGLLKKAGYQNVAELLGGLKAWNVSGFQIEGTY